MKSFVLIFLSLLLLNAIEAQPVISGLVASWKMNGNFNDASGNGINGTNVGATAATNKAGQANSAMAFSNPTSTVSQYATMPVNAAINFPATQNYSISMLVFVNSPFVPNGGLFDNNLNYGGYGFWVWLYPTLELRFFSRGNSIGALSFPIGSWVHITGVRNNGILNLYVNGILKSSGAEGTLTPTYVYKSVFGTMFYSPYTPPYYNGFNGKLDEVTIYNRALSNAEIASLASALLPLKLGDFSAIKKSTGTVLYWQTISETNTKSFQIERSTDGSNFTTIGEVKANGNSSQPLNYQFADASVQNTTIFYRLRMEDLDGTAT